MTSPSDVDGDTASTQLAALAQAALDIAMGAEPLAASLYGIPGYDDQLGDLSAESEAATVTAMTSVAQRSAVLDRSALSDQERVTAAVLVALGQSAADSQTAALATYTASDLMISPAPGLFSVLPIVPIAGEGQAEAYLARLAAVPAYLEQAAQRLAEGRAMGREGVARLVRAAIRQLDSYAEGVAEGVDPLARDAPSELADEADWVSRRDRLLAQAVHPALAATRDDLAGSVLPGARDDDHAGLAHLGDGSALYAACVRLHTTTDADPADLHAIGLGVLDDLDARFARLGRSLYGEDDPVVVRRRLREDPSLAYASADQILADAAEAVARAEAALPGYFGHLPQGRCAVEPVPSLEAPGAPPAYYRPPALDGSRAGTYFANTFEPHNRRRPMAQAVAFHEAVPGHHLQIAIAMESEGLPMVRRLGGFTAYVEGWGLYAETLAEEMGLYTDDAALLGLAATIAWRAGRLVVDTGLHAMGWTRDQAVQLMATRTGVAALEVGTEVDRYIAWPGQALAYMVGRLEFQRLRAQASESLGEAFSLSAFHDVVLGAGSLPLRVLADRVTEWTAAQLA